MTKFDFHRLMKFLWLNRLDTILVRKALKDAGFELVTLFTNGLQNVQIMQLLCNLQKKTICFWFRF